MRVRLTSLVCELASSHTCRLAQLGVDVTIEGVLGFINRLVARVVAQDLNLVDFDVISVVVRECVQRATRSTSDHQGEQVGIESCAIWVNQFVDQVATVGFGQGRGANWVGNGFNPSQRMRGQWEVIGLVGKLGSRDAHRCSSTRVDHCHRESARRRVSIQVGGCHSDYVVGSRDSAGSHVVPDEGLVVSVAIQNAVKGKC